MAIKDVLKVSRKTFFNPRAWLGYDSLKEQTQTIQSFVKDAATIRKPEVTETFEEALKRLDLKKEDLKSTERTYLSYALLFLVLAVIDFLWGFYLLFHHGAFLGLVLALAVFALLLAQAFRYHFWVFQIRQQKLGCTFEEWRDSLLGKDRKSKSP